MMCHNSYTKTEVRGDRHREWLKRKVAMVKELAWKPAQIGGPQTLGGSRKDKVKELPRKSPISQ